MGVRLSLFGHLPSVRATTTPPTLLLHLCSQAAEKHVYCKILDRNPCGPRSLDAPLHGGGEPPHQRPVLSTATASTLRLEWLSDEVPVDLLFEERQAAGFSQRHTTRYCTCSQIL